MKLKPDYKSDDSILDEDSDDDSVELTDSKTQLYEKRKSKEDSSKGKSQFEIEKEKPEPKSKSKNKKHVEFESQPDIFSDIYFESDTVIAPGSKLEGSEIAITSDNVSNNVSTESTSHPS